MKRVLLVSDGLVHPPVTARAALHRALSSLEGFSIRRAQTLEALPDHLDGLSALVIYIHHKRISDRALAALAAFVSGGGGLLGVHSATASFKDQACYAEILGGRFTGHDKAQRFEITPQAHTGPFTGLPSFTIRDELYLHTLQPDIEVHFTSTYRGQDIPVVWTRRHGQGKVCYAVAGHTAASLRHPSVREILTRGLAWVAS